MMPPTGAGAMSVEALPRTLFTDDHLQFRDQVRRFVANEVVPHHAMWEEAGFVPREVWAKAGDAGLLCPTVPEEYGGAGADFLFSVVVIEELSRVWATGPGFVIHSEMAAPYIAQFGDEAQKRRWLPRLVSGRSVIGVAMSEPGAGSDLRGMRTRATQTNTGFTLNGQKVFISNGQTADVFIVAARNPDARGGSDLSLFLVEADTPGFRRGRNLDKLGVHAQDTSELFFEDVALPRESLLGTQTGEGMRQMMHGLGRERLAIAVGCIAKAEGALAQTVRYAADRALFGKRLVDFQNTQFKLAEMQASIVVGRAMVDHLLRLYLDGQLDPAAAASAKLWSTEMLGKVVDECLQLHGGWGYMREFQIARAYADARVERIAGGTSEVMKTIICRSLLKGFGVTMEPS